MLKLLVVSAVIAGFVTLVILARVASRSFPGQKYPRRLVYRKDGYKVTVWCYGAFGHFVYGLAQRNDYRGSVTIMGPKLRWPVKTGWLLWPLNLSGEGMDRNPINAVRAQITSWQRLEVPSGLEEILREATRPYRGSSRYFS
ncbi:MAG TPA: hypothetical protein VLE72_01365 [Candidatus Saccharimonadales bacterium]|nr:hypothetical protein [Candidatus Saccharimonadales bacterium]